MRIALVTLTMCLVALPANAKYSGGTGEPNDPYQIATAADLIALGETPEDYDKHFILTADIDLDPNLPGRKVFDRAVIAQAMNGPVETKHEGTGLAFIRGHDFDGAAFAGTFDGNNHRIRHLVVQGGAYPFVGLFGCIAFTGSVHDLSLTNLDVHGSTCVGGLAGSNRGTISACHVAGRVSGLDAIGGLVGANLGKGYSLLRGPVTAKEGASIVNCSASCEVIGGDRARALGGLVGDNGLLQCCEMPLMEGTIRGCRATGNVSGGIKATGLGGVVGWHGWGTITDCYAAVSVTAGGEGRMIGGLAGYHSEGVARCYSVGPVSTGQASQDVGGLTGESFAAPDNSFWDIQKSGQTTSAGGVGKTTAEMQTAGTFLEAGWDFVGEAGNGTEDVWWIFDGRDYPRLWWEWVVDDDFEDGEAGPLWFVYAPEPELVQIKEVNGRLETTASAEAQNVDAIYVANGWRLDVTKDFAIRVDFHFSRQDGHDGRVTLGVVPGLDPSAMQWAELEAGCFETGPFYLYEVSDRGWVQERIIERFVDEGTLYMSYNCDTDELYFSQKGYGKANAWGTMPGLLKGRWNSEPVYIILSGGSEGMALTGEDAWLDNLVVNSGTLILSEPDDENGPDEEEPDSDAD